MQMYWRKDSFTKSCFILQLVYVTISSCLRSTISRPFDTDRKRTELPTKEQLGGETPFFFRWTFDVTYISKALWQKKGWGVIGWAIHLIGFGHVAMSGQRWRVMQKDSSEAWRVTFAEEDRMFKGIFRVYVYACCQVAKIKMSQVNLVRRNQNMMPYSTCPEPCKTMRPQKQKLRSASQVVMMHDRRCSTDT